MGLEYYDATETEGRMKDHANTIASVFTVALLLGAGTFLYCRSSDTGPVTILFTAAAGVAGAIAGIKATTQPPPGTTTATVTQIPPSATPVGDKPQ